MYRVEGKCPTGQFEASVSELTLAVEMAAAFFEREQLESGEATVTLQGQQGSTRLVHLRWDVTDGVDGAP